jgi:pyruvate dehydrogenase E2 component (dihydrolipoamide acetyltransferase)
MAEATIIKWHKKEGEKVSKGEPLLEVETAKVNNEVETPASGTLAKILVSEGATVQIGTLLAIITEPGEKFEESPASFPASQIVAPPGPSPAPRSSPAATESSAQARIQVEPRAKRLAQQLGIDSGAIRGTGPNGRITVEDVEKAKDTSNKPTGRAEDWVSLTGRRKTIAERMLRSNLETAALTLMTEADVTGMEAFREGLKERGIRPLHIVIKAIGAALKEHPRMNAHLKGDQMRLVPDVNVGVAVDVEEGLIVPVIHKADQKSISTIAQEVKTLSEKARSGQLTVAEATGGTFTVTNLGALDIDSFTPIINQPEIGILAVGRIVEKAAIYQGMITKRSMMWLSLTFDHRLIDGAPAGAFLRSIKARLENLSWLVS